MYSLSGGHPLLERLQNLLEMSFFVDLLTLNDLAMTNVFAAQRRIISEVIAVQRSVRVRLRDLILNKVIIL